MKKWSLTVLLILALTGCTAVSAPVDSSSEPQTEGIAGLSAENYPHVDGSTATLPLIAGLYSRATGTDRQTAESLVSVSKTSSAWRSLYQHGCDLLIVYEAPEEIAQEISRMDFEIQPLGLDALVFLVNRGNPVDTLSQTQLQDIYAGEITDWSEVGGEPGPIQAFQRNPQSGSQALFLKLLMKDRDPMEPLKGLVPEEMQALVEGVAEYDGEGASLGYSVYYYAQEMVNHPDVKLLAVDGVAPNEETIAQKQYPLINNFYAVIRADEEPGSPARILFNWLKSEEGRGLVKEEGYVPAN
ncbi:substrate-binding domain-containing protein [Holdemania massiliensis]|uniref:substrate-binding domain-containing protein n=1 Tax=Holdemania massiliensis TaxID=1468449 RepID=UPI00356550DA